MHLSDLIGSRQVITVSGAHKGVGKTALSEILLRNLPNFAAIKITITDEDAIVTDDEQVIMTPSTDTCRMRQSGAGKVVWVRSTEVLLPDAMKGALGKLPPRTGILIEGNSILFHLKPAIAFFVVKPPFDAMKPSRVHALQNANVCIINQVDGLLSVTELSRRIKVYNPALLLLTINLLDPAGSTANDYGRLLTFLTTHLA